MTDTSAKPSKPLVLDRSQIGPRSRLKPIVLEYHSRQAKASAGQEPGGRERYSAGLADIQRAEVDLLRVARRAARAFAKGFDTYDRERQHSAQTKKDGAIEDFPHNTAKALSESLREAADLPLDLAEAVAPKNYRKRMRRNIRNASRVLRVFRM